MEAIDEIIKKIRAYADSQLLVKALNKIKDKEEIDPSDLIAPDLFPGYCITIRALDFLCELGLLEKFEVSSPYKYKNIGWITKELIVQI